MRGPLSDAIEAYDLNEMKRLVFQKEADVNERYGDPYTFCPLVLAVKKNWLEGVEFLVHAKADVNTCDDQRWSVLQEACLLGGEGMEKITRFLLQNGAIVDQKGYMGAYPIHTATNLRSVASLKEICRVTKQIDVCNASASSALALAIYGNNMHSAAVLLDHGAKIAKTHIRIRQLAPWFNELAEQRKSLKKTLIVLFACSKPLITKDVAKILISMVWSTRDDPNWKR